MHVEKSSRPMQRGGRGGRGRAAAGERSLLCDLNANFHIYEKSRGGEDGPGGEKGERTTTTADRVAVVEI